MFQSLHFFPKNYPVIRFIAIFAASLSVYIRVGMT
jgi:hypothetical protein